MKDLDATLSDTKDQLLEVRSILLQQLNEWGSLRDLLQSSLQSQTHCDEALNPLNLVDAICGIATAIARQGLSRRDALAAQAIQPMIQAECNKLVNEPSYLNIPYEQLIEAAYQIADEMIRRSAEFRGPS